MSKLSRSQRMVGREYNPCPKYGRHQMVRQFRDDPATNKVLVILVCDCKHEETIDLVEQPGTIRANEPA